MGMVAHTFNPSSQGASQDYTVKFHLSGVGGGLYSIVYIKDVGWGLRNGGDQVSSIPG